MKKLIAAAIIVSLSTFATALADPAPKVYEPVSRPHSAKEKAIDFGVMYVVLWTGYIASQYDVVEKISFQDFTENVFEKGAVLWDGDEYYWNFIAHPYVGSEYYLYFRSRGYAPRFAFLNAAITSTIFEISVETFSEPFSFNDFVITPVLGSGLGYLREHAGLRLVNSDNKFYRVVGHVLYLETNLWFFEETHVAPVISSDLKFTGIAFQGKF